MNNIPKAIIVGAVGVCVVLWAFSHEKALHMDVQVGKRNFEFSSEFSCLRLSWNDWEMPLPSGSKSSPAPLFKLNSCGFDAVSETRFPGPFSFHEPGFLGAFSASTRTVEKQIPKRFISKPRQPDFDLGLIASPASRYFVFPHICIPMWVALFPLVTLIPFVTRKRRPHPACTA